MNVALDYDRTYTLDKSGWGALIRCFQSQGHKVTVVTMRSETEDYHDDFDNLRNFYGVDTIFTDGIAKKTFAGLLGLSYDVWIDDNPAAILYDSPLTAEQLTEWRENGRQ